jgi:serine/threonine protein kinase
MDFLHNKKNLLHRDIKPENILLNMSGKVKLTDFGISKEVSKTQNVIGTFVGTRTYM